MLAIKKRFFFWGNVAVFYSWVYWDQTRQFTIAFMANTDMPQWVKAANKRLR